MEKERVTKAIITSELIRIQKDKLLWLLVAIGLIFLLFFWIPLGLFGKVGLFVYIGILVLLGAPIIIYYTNRISKIRKNKFHIFSDKLMGYHSDFSGDLDHHAFDSGKKYELHFAGVSPYVIYVNNLDSSKKIFYRWSETYAMSAGGVYNTSLVGDEFYIISIDNHSADLFFNKKFFELD